MKSKLFLAVLSLPIILVSCGKNPYLEAKSKSDKTKKVLRVDQDKEEETEEPVIDKPVEVSETIKLPPTDLGLIQVDKLVRFNLTLQKDNLNKLKSLKILQDNENLKSLKFELSKEVVTAAPIYFEYTPNKIGNIKLPVSALVKIKNLKTKKIENKKIDSFITAKVVDQDKTNNALELIVKSQKDLFFGPISLGSTESKDILVKNTSNKTAFISKVLQNNSNHFKVELINLKDGDDCEKMVKDICLMRITFQPKYHRDLTDTVRLEFSHNDNNYGEVVINTTGETLDSTKCVAKSTRIYLPELKSELIKEKRNVELPYYLTKKSTDITLDLLINHDYNKSIDTLDGRLLYVEDAQIYSSFDISKDKNLGSMLNVGYYADFIKNLDTEVDRWNRTEIFCLENSKTCSGEMYYDREYRRHKNRKYKLLNKDFTKIMFANGIQGESSKYLNALEFTGMINLEILGKKSLEKLKEDNKAKFIIADDIKLKTMPLLFINYEKKRYYNECVQ